MKNIRFITRADDLGSSFSANQAITQAADGGFIKNMSVMACGPTVEDAARRLAGRKDICFGMHMTLNAEWDRVKWGPVLDLGAQSGLTDEKGNFLSHPSAFARTKPAVETVMKEVAAQLERLRKLGFAIRYIDSHMLPEMYIEGLDEAIAEFAVKKGLLDHMYYYRLPPWGMTLNSPGDMTRLPDGQYFTVFHPSLDTPEMRLTGNASVSGETVARERAGETALLTSRDTLRQLEQAGIRSIRYDEAAFDERLTVQEMVRILSGN